MRKAIFIDQDDTLIIDFVYNVTKIEFIHKVVNYLRRNEFKNYKLILITNQSGIGRKKFTESQLTTFQNKLKQEVLNIGLNLLDIFYCPHIPEDQCHCRKPSPKMIIDAIAKHNLDINECFYIGDKKTDEDCAINAGVKFIYTQKIISGEF